MQTVAVYYEAKPKTYGFSKIEGLALARLKVPLTKGAAWIQKNKSSNESGIKYTLALLSVIDESEILLVLLIKEKYKAKVLEILGRRFDVEPDGIDIIFPVELVFFQGPHFGDRWGIAASAFKAMEKGGVDVLLAGCSGSAVYLVVSKGQAKKAVSFLKEVFQAPQ